MRLCLFSHDIPVGYRGVILNRRNKVVELESSGRCHLSFGERIIVFPQRQLIWEEKEEIAGSLPTGGGLSFPVVFTLRVVWQYPTFKSGVTRDKLERLVSIFPHGDNSNLQKGTWAQSYVSQPLRHTLDSLYSGQSWEQLFEPAHKGKEIQLPRENQEELAAAGIEIGITILSTAASDGLRKHLEEKAKIEREGEVRKVREVQEAETSRHRKEVERENSLAEAHTKAEISKIQTQAQVEAAQTLEVVRKLERAGKLESALNEVRAFAERQKPITPLSVMYKFAEAYGAAAASQAQLPSELLRVFVNNLTSEESSKLLQKATEKIAQLPAGQSHPRESETPKEAEDDEGG